MGHCRRLEIISFLKPRREGRCRQEGVNGLQEGASDQAGMPRWLHAGKPVFHRLLNLLPALSVLFMEQVQKTADSVCGFLLGSGVVQLINIFRNQSKRGLDNDFNIKPQ